MQNHGNVHIVCHFVTSHSSGLQNYDRDLMLSSAVESGRTSFKILRPLSIHFIIHYSITLLDYCAESRHAFWLLVNIQSTKWITKFCFSAVWTDSGKTMFTSQKHRVNWNDTTSEGNDIIYMLASKQSRTVSLQAINEKYIFDLPSYFQIEMC